MADDSTIVIKKINKGGHGYHGGAWKVAYADFVTAMMAFFLLLWLLNATEAENLAGLADYFAPTVGIKGEMGIGFRGGKAALSSGIGADKNTNKGIVFGGVPVGPIIKVHEKIEESTDEADSEKISITIGGDDNSGRIESSGEYKSQNPDAQEIDADEQQRRESFEDYVAQQVEDVGSNEDINIKSSSEGVEIQIKGRGSMFTGDNAILKPDVEIALLKVAQIFKQLPNYISISGHTSSLLVKSRDIGTWELSSKRANVVRLVLEKGGVQKEQIAKIIGESDNYPLNKENPSSSVNNRVTIVLLRDATLPQHKKSAPEQVFIDADSKDAQEVREDQADPSEGDISNGNEPDTAPKGYVIEEFNDDEAEIAPDSADEESFGDPFLGKDAAAPTDLFKTPEYVGDKKSEPKKPVNLYLLEEDDDEEEFENEEINIDIDNLFSPSDNPSMPMLDIR